VRRRDREVQRQVRAERHLHDAVHPARGGTPHLLDGIGRPVVHDPVRAGRPRELALPGELAVATT
jgi:hypothetical protein